MSRLKQKERDIISSIINNIKTMQVGKNIIKIFFLLISIFNFSA